MHVSFRGFFALGVGKVVVAIYPAGPDQQNIADLDVSSLACGQDIDALVFCAVEQVGKGYGVSCIRVVGLSRRGLGVRPVVE